MTTTRNETRSETSSDPPAATELERPGEHPRVAELEAELDRVKTDRSVERERLDRRAAWRRFFSTTLAVIAAASIVASVTGIWVRTTALDSQRFAAATAPLVRNDDVARAISEYAAAEIVTHTGAQAEIERVLPPDAQVLAGPIASALQDGLAVAVDDVIQTQEFESVFEVAVRVAHEEATLLLDGDGEVIESKNGLVTLNLLGVINEVLRATSTELSALLGTNITLPTIDADDVPAAQVAELEAALGVQLPADFGQVTLFESSQLAEAQRLVDRFDTWLEVLVVIALVATVGAFVLAEDRRRTVIVLGLTVPALALVTWLVTDAGEASYADHIEDPTARAAARAAADVVFSGLDRVAWWTIGLSLLAVVVAQVTRPSAVPVGAPAEHEQPAAPDEEVTS